MFILPVENSLILAELIFIRCLWQMRKSNWCDELLHQFARSWDEANLANEMTFKKCCRNKAKFNFQIESFVWQFEKTYRFVPSFNSSIQSETLLIFQSCNHLVCQVYFYVLWLLFHRRNNPIASLWTWNLQIFFHYACAYPEIYKQCRNSAF